jgi:Protein of unknown function (DUF3048) N-terminal domain/Protein of unknown function (DUF3048) C-terminal domain
VKHTRTTTTFVIAAFAIVACSSSGDSAPATSAAAAAAVTVPGTEVVAVTTPTSGANDASTTSLESTTTASTIPAKPVMPLTGLPISDQALAGRPALVVKIDNHPDARPQSGLNQADIVFEENVEHLTRFAAVFQSTAPDPVGPIRSGRTQDVELLGSLNKPIFAWSGGNPGVTKAINGSDFVVANVQSNARSASKSFRSRDRAAPHNLYAQGSGLFTMAPPAAGPPPQQFKYRDDGVTAGGVASAGVDLKMDGVNVSWKYDTKSGNYLRFQGGTAHNDAALGQVNAANVVVLVVDYRASAVDKNSPEAQTTGTGEVFAFSADKVVHGKWVRTDRLSPFLLTADDGSSIVLTPGRTWVELARTDSTTPMAG